MKLEYKVVVLYLVSLFLILAKAIESVQNVTQGFVAFIMLILVTYVAFFNNKKDGSHK